SLVTDGVTGLLFDPRRADELTAGLHRVLTDQTLAAALVRAARKTLIERHDLAACVEPEIPLLTTLRTRPRARPRTLSPVAATRGSWPSAAGNTPRITASA